MADSTVALNFDDRLDTKYRTDLLKTGEVVYIGVFSALDTTTGKIENADDASGLLNLGVFVTESNGKPANSTGDGTIKWVSQSGQITKGRTVTGVASRADVGKLVYPTDNQTLTLTRPSVGTPIGIVYEHVSGTTCDVYLLTFAEAIILSASGGGFVSSVQQIAVVPNNNPLEGTSAIDIANSKMSGHGKITGFYATCLSADAGTVAGSQTFTLDLAGSAVTGASLVLTSATAQGARVDSSAITATNEYHNGDVLKLKMSASGTGFTADKLSAYAFYIISEALPGA